MTQQINLYGVQMRPVRDPLPAVRMAGIALAALVLLGGVFGWDAWRLNEARAQAQAMRTVLAARQSELAELAKTIGARRTDVKLEQDLARVESMHRARTQLKALLDSGALGAPGGFSEPMRALARQSSSGLWLTGFTLAHGQVELQGRALTADLVPTYLRRLGQEKALSGVAFNALRISQPVADRAGTGPSAPGTPSSAAAAGAGAPGVAAGAAGGAGPRATLPAFIEFQVASDAAALAAERPR